MLRDTMVAIYIYIYIMLLSLWMERGSVIE